MHMRMDTRSRYLKSCLLLFVATLPATCSPTAHVCAVPTFCATLVNPYYCQFYIADDFGAPLAAAGLGRWEFVKIVMIQDALFLHAEVGGTARRLFSQQIFPAPSSPPVRGEPLVP